jgi:predicted nuclease of restriction endonuclease-like (RecB) superfamily
VTSTIDSASYSSTLAELKTRIRSARIAAQRKVNTELIELYWSIGRIILDRQSAEGWGSKVIERLAEDLRREFPEMRGFSRANLFYMRKFADVWDTTSGVVQLPVGRLPWGHIIDLLDKLDDQSQRDWYAAAAVEHGWSRAVLVHQIRSHAYTRLAAAPTNFADALERHDSELAQQLTKDPYVLDFVALDGDAAERELEQALVERIIDTLRELGAGFAFVGRQVHFDVDGDDFFIDLLFFHTEQLRYVVIELKTSKFKPEHLGQLGFYVSLVDDRLRRTMHAPTVGLLLCADKNDAVVRYALAGSQSPVAISSYDLLPADAREALPTEAEITRALDG